MPWLLLENGGSLLLEGLGYLEQGLVLEPALDVRDNIVVTKGRSHIIVVEQRDYTAELLDEQERLILAEERQ